MFLNIFMILNLALATSPFLSWESFEKSPSPKALIFISKNCPCSKAHVEHIKKISKNNPILNTFVVASEPINNQKAEEYYKNIEISVIKDNEQRLIKKYKALKTPHLTLIDKGSVVYQGGVTNNINPKYASKLYFKEVANALTENKPLPFQKGRSLGCYIKRL